MEEPRGSLFPNARNRTMLLQYNLIMSTQCNVVPSFITFIDFTHNYNLLAITLAFSLFLCALLFLVSFLLSAQYLSENEKNSEYECGFEPFDSSTRQPFDVQFYLVGILFRIFDVEVALLFP